MLACRLDLHEAGVLANATRFVACTFRGCGRYEPAECADLVCRGDQACVGAV